MKNDLRDVFTAIDLSRVTFRRIRLNFVWALGYNLIAIPIGEFLFFCWLGCDCSKYETAIGALYLVTGFQLPPGVAAAFQATSTLLVVVSSILLNLYTKKDLDIHSVRSRSVNLENEEGAPLLN